MIGADVAGVGYRILELVPPPIPSWLARHLEKSTSRVGVDIFCLVVAVCAVLRVSVARGPGLSANTGVADEPSRWVN